VSDQLMNAAEQLSSMADKVAGFAISSDLLLIFACLKKDIGPWVQKQPMAFAIGTGVAGIVYVAAVWWLYSRELHVLAAAQPSGDLPLLTDVSWWLVWARSLGIAAFTGIGILAVLGASKRS
jgi:hypothetical protein